LRGVKPCKGGEEGGDGDRCCCRVGEGVCRGGRAGVSAFAVIIMPAIGVVRIAMPDDVANEDGPAWPASLADDERGAPRCEGGQKPST
jgi:hypothetical protein